MSTRPGKRDQRPWPRDMFLARLREVGERHYHDRHAFHVLMHAGKLNRRQIQGWVANRFYYQTQIPIKDAAIISNCQERGVRSIWIRRILTHDGTDGEVGGIEKWILLGRAVGLTERELVSNSRLLPAVRYAVDAYVDFCRTQPWIIAVASSLTELFAPTLMSRRIEAFEQHYPWVREEGLRYFRGRVTEARRECEHALGLVLERCRSRDMQEQALAALKFKCDLLWAILDAVHLAYVLNPANPP